MSPWKRLAPPHGVEVGGNFKTPLSALPRASQRVCRRRASHGYAQATPPPVEGRSRSELVAAISRG